jgi:hypothetical protein
MTCSLLRRTFFLLLASFLGACFTAPVSACPFCSVQGKTLTEQVTEASMVLYGSLANAKLDPNNDLGQGTTDLHIEEILKKDPFLGDKKVLTLPRYLPTDNNKIKFLIFCDVFKGKLDLLGGIAVKNNGDMVKYLKGAQAVRGKEIGERLRFFFDYLDNADMEIANDAYKEFGYADYKDYREMAKKLPAEKIAAWIQDPETPAFRLGLYASMLGHCGTEKDAELLRKMLDDSQKRLTSGIDGIMAGYTLLKPKEGWAYIRAILKDPSKEITLRYAALRAARFFWNSRPDVVDKKELIAGVCLMLDDGNTADLAIEDLRKWGCWDVADRVLALYDKPSHDVPIVRRAILRYALSCPDKDKTGQFVDSLRKKDAEMVKDAEELLKFDTDTATAKPAGAK